MKLYVVTAYRLSDRNNYSYLIGVYSTRNAARKAGRKEATERGYKYGYGIDECELDCETDDTIENIINPHDPEAWEADKPDDE